jgi:putative ABC transport system permease protein
MRAFLRRLFGRGRRPTDADIQRELAFHVAMETRHREARGLDAGEARRTALVDFGGVDRTREEVRDVRGMTFRETLAQDLRIGARMLVRAPGYSAAVIAILALGIGANTAMFSVINGVLLKPLPFKDGGNLVLVQHSSPLSNIADSGVSINELYEYRQRLASVTDLVEFHGMSFTLLNQGEPDRVDTGVVSANFFDMLGITPVEGRTFIQSDAVLGAPAVLMLSYEYWQQKFGGEKSVVGRVLQMNNKPHTIVGVLPPFPQYPRRNDVYMPTSACPFRADSEATMHQDHRSFAGLRVFGRLAKGKTVDQATAEVSSVAKSYAESYAKDYQGDKGFDGRTRLLGEQLVQGARSMLFTLVGVTALVLLLACANVANLALARTVRRGRELAVRSALGAGRLRLVRQLVTESVLLSTLGGIAGLGLAWLSLDLLVGFIGRFTPRTGQIEIDGTVLAFTAIASVVTGVAFGMAPALGTGRNLTRAIRDGGAQAGDGAGRQRLRAALVVAQVAVSFALIVGAALLIKSFYRLSSVPLGFNTEHTMTASIGGNFTRMATPEDTERIHRDVLERLRATPGVRAAAATNAVPQLSAQPVQRPVIIEGRTAGDGRKFEANFNFASDSYFRTLEVPVLAGREFQTSDRLGAPRVAVINASMAKYWEGANPVGARFARQPAGSAEPVWLTVVGIVPDFHLYSVDREVAAQYYQPVAQGFGGRLIIRADLPDAEIAKVIRTSVHAVDDQIPVEDVQTLEQVRGTQLVTPGVTTALLTIFAGVALLVTLAGLAGLVGTSVSQRTREFGLRMALGASRLSVLRLVLGQGLLLTVIGLALGLTGAYFFTQLVSQFLFETTRTDTVVYVAAALVFVAATLVASAGPARRATGIDPLKALKAE